MPNEMNQKKMFIVKLANFLVANKMHMSGQELVDFLNRNGFTTGYGTEYQGGRGIYKLLSETYNWLSDLGLDDEKEKFAHVFVDKNGNLPWDKN
jgi:hypothetical protein